MSFEDSPAGEQLVQELAEVRAKLAAKEQQVRELAQELSILKTQKLPDCEDRFQIFMDNSPTIAWVKDEEGRHVYLSRTYEERFGVQFHDLRGKTDTELWPPDIAEEFRKNDLAAIAAGHAIEVIEEAVNPDGSRCHWLSSKFSFCDTAGNRYLAGIGVDITKLKQTEEALRQSERRYRELVQYANSAIIRWSCDDTVVFINEYAQEFFGWKAEEVLGKHMGILLPERGSTGTDMTGAVQDICTFPERYVSYTAENTCRDGRRVWMTWTNRAIRDEDGKVIEILAIGNDITARKLAEEALRSSQERYWALFKAIDEGFCIVEVLFDASGDPVDYRFLETNPAFKGQTGLYDVVGKRMREIEPRHEKHWFETYGRIAMTGEPERFTNIAEYLNRWFDVYAFRIGRPEERKVAILFSDITARKRAEESLRQLNVTLEQRVAERTEIAEARARQLQELAVELIDAEERERERIAGLLHEDLQQILAAARMQLLTACTSSISDPILKRVEQLLTESINKSRRLSHELSPAALHHSDLVTALQWLAGQIKDQFGLQVHIESGGIQNLEGGALRVFIFRAVQELLLNIVKHAKVESARIDLSRTDQWFVLTVSDQGRGFNPEVLESYTVSSGFGLLSLRERARYVGGSLSVESAPGMGSRFTLTVPISLPKASEAQQKLS
jgi:PAS domain S-box-containing protein